MTIVNQLGGGLVGGGAVAASRGGGGMGMCTCSSCHNMLSSISFTTTTISNTIVTIDEILFGLFVLLILMPWDIVAVTV
ncbi:unnamed protein product [Sphagnum jensenii]|uniref:Uncharacterized protein n=1 Tax=Sphagnum jensenii TaxID=128206 RepID=A0ABP0WZX6_9BRYO